MYQWISSYVIVIAFVFNFKLSASFMTVLGYLVYLLLQQNWMHQFISSFTKIESITFRYYIFIVFFYIFVIRVVTAFRWKFTYWMKEVAFFRILQRQNIFLASPTIRAMTIYIDHTHMWSIWCHCGLFVVNLWFSCRLHLRCLHPPYKMGGPISF